MKRIILSALLFGFIQTVAMAEAPAGLVAVPSNQDVSTTTDKLVAALEGKGLTVFARIDHSAGAKTVGMDLAPTELVIFGSPKLGTVLMHCGHSIGIDLPLKALIWQDAEGTVWLAYNAPEYLAGRHRLEGCEKPLEKVTGALAKFAETATK